MNASENTELDMAAELFIGPYIEVEAGVPPGANADRHPVLSGTGTTEDKENALNALLGLSRVERIKLGGYFNEENAQGLISAFKALAGTELEQRAGEELFKEAGYCEKTGDFQGACWLYEASLDFKAADAEDKYFRFNNLGFCLVFLKRFEEASDYLEKAIELAPEKHNAWKNEGVSVEHQGAITAAAECYINAINKSRGESRCIKHFKRLLARHPELKKNPLVQTFLLNSPYELETGGNKIMKPLRFTLLQTLCGALIGWVLVAYFMDVYSTGEMFFMPVNMWTDWLRMESLTEAFRQYRQAGGLLAALAACVSWYAVARRLNPAMPAFPFFKTPAPALVWMAFLLSGCLFYAGITSAVAVNSPFFGDFVGGIFNFGGYWTDRVLGGLFSSLCCSLAWLLISPEGWAGGYTKRARRIFPWIPGLLLFLTFGVLCVVFLGSTAENLDSSSSHYFFITVLFLLLLALLALAGWPAYRLVVFLRGRWERAALSAGPEAPEDNPRYLKTAALGLSFELLLWFGVFLAVRMIEFLFSLHTAIWTPALDICYAGMAGTIIILFVTGAVFWGAGVALAPAFAAVEISPAVRLKTARWPLSFLAAVMIVNGFLYQDAVRRYDWKAGGLAAAARLNTLMPGHIASLTLGYKDKKRVTILDAWPTAVHYGFFGAAEGEVPATEENAALLGKFLTGGEKNRFRHAAAAALPDIYAALWQQEKTILAREEAARIFKIVPKRWYWGELSWLTRAAPVTEVNLKRLLELSAPGRYRVSGAAAVQLADAWLRFGDNQRAAFWLAEAARQGVSAKESGKHPAAGAVTALTNGTIRGRIDFPEISSGKDIIVGLFCSTGETYPPSQYGFNHNLVASQRPGKGGSFQFASLAGGGYYISLLVPAKMLHVDSTNINRKEQALKVAGHPGIMTLSRNQPVIDTGRITIQVD